MGNFQVSSIGDDAFEVTELEVMSGTRPRLTLIKKNSGQKLFFKTWTHNTREVWAECLASHIAEQMGIPGQAVTIRTLKPEFESVFKEKYIDQLPKNWQPVGTLARNIFPKDVEIRYGAAIVNHLSKPLTLEQIENSIRADYYAPDDILNAFADMVIFDALIGNMDRHHQNWGICEHIRYRQQVLTGKKRLIDFRWFTPLFDHGSSLMFELRDKNVKELLDNEDRLKQYVEGSTFGFILDTQGQRNNVFSTIQQHLDNNTPWAYRFIKSLNKVKSMDMLAVAGLFIRMPTSGVLEFSPERRKLLYKALLLRYNKLVDLLGDNNG